MWNLKTNTNECIFRNRNRLTGIEANLWLPNGRGKGEEQIRGTRLKDTNYYV